MSVYWKPEESRLVQERASTSAANALSIRIPSSPDAVPAGKLWIVTGFGYSPDAAETQTIGIAKRNAGGTYFAVLNPVSLALNPMYATFLENGSEFFLMPGEYILVWRSAATAGSHMQAYMQIVEIDQPLYTYEEPQLVKRNERFVSSIRRAMATSVGGGGSRGGGGGPAPMPGGRGPRPK